MASIATGGRPEWMPEPGPEMSLYRGRVVALLRRYFQLSLESGRLPSLVGRECFRAKVTSYRMHTFEDLVIFVHDIEQVLDTLDDFSKKLVARVIFQEYTQEEAARLLGCTRRTVVRQLPAALDELAARFLRNGLIAAEKKSCQGAKPEGMPGSESRRTEYKA